MAEFKKGDRVRRSIKDGGIQPGTLGIVNYVDSLDIGVIWKGERHGQIYPLNGGYIEPAPAEPTASAIAADSKLADALCELLMPFAGEHGATEGAIDVLRRKLRELATARKQRDEVLDAKLSFSDLCGERDRLKEKLAWSEAEVFRLTTENVRLQGQKRRPW
jgi:hypothetical protein